MRLEIEIYFKGQSEPIIHKLNEISKISYCNKGNETALLDTEQSRSYLEYEQLHNTLLQYVAMHTGALCLFCESDSYVYINLEEVKFFRITKYY